MRRRLRLPCFAQTCTWVRKAGSRRIRRSPPRLPVHAGADSRSCRSQKWHRHPPVGVNRHRVCVASKVSKSSPAVLPTSLLSTFLLGSKSLVRNRGLMYRVSPAYAAQSPATLCCKLIWNTRVATKHGISPAVLIGVLQFVQFASVGEISGRPLESF